MNIRDGAKVALWLFLCVACSGDLTHGDEALPGVTFEPIIGGTPATGYPEAAYLNIDMSPSGGWACSGTLIAPRVVLTAGHCVDSHSYWEVYVGNAYRQTSSAAVYDYNEHGSETVNPAHHDIGLVFLSDPVNLASYPTLSKVKVADNTSVIDVGRVKNGVVQSTEYQASTSVSAGDKVGYPFDYTSKDVIEPGDSGGPVFTAGTHTVIAVNSGAGNGIQVLARTDLVYDWITSQIAAHGGTSVSGGSGGSAGAGGAAGKAAGGAGGTAGKAAAGTGGTAGKPAAGTGGTGGKPAAGAGGAAMNAAGSGGGAGSKAGAAGAAGAKAGAAGAGGSSTCSGAREIEPNDAWSQATALSGSACGELSTTSDVDWYSVSASVGTHVLALTSASDAAFSIGVASGSNCVLSISNVKSANLTVSGAPATLCIKASSPGKKTQSYGLSFK
jgi:hypothetical protein